MIRKIIKTLIPKEIQTIATNFRILGVDFAQFKSMKRKECIGANDHPIPWYTYPAIEYINQLDLSSKTVFEYGSGNSSRFWADRCKNLVSVEDNKDWYDKIGEDLPPNAEYHLIEDESSYISFISSFEHKFDVIIIDGKYRNACAQAALAMLSDDGFIILDNSDWHEKTSALLRNADLIEVDMSGFGPINNYTWTTSFYFTRSVKLQPSSNRQPIHGIGALLFDER